MDVIDIMPNVMPSMGGIGTNVEMMGMGMILGEKNSSDPITKERGEQKMNCVKRFAASQLKKTLMLLIPFILIILIIVLQAKKMLAPPTSVYIVLFGSCVMSGIYLRYLSFWKRPRRIYAIASAKDLNELNKWCQSS